MRKLLEITHTYAILEISETAYVEIREKLAEAGYQHSFRGGVIDMHGIALTRAMSPVIEPEPTVNEA